MLLFLTMSGPQVVPSAAGMNLVSHRCPTRWHQSDLQMSCQTNQTNEKVVYNQRVSPPLDADTQGVLKRTTQSIQQNRSNSVKGAPPRSVIPSVSTFIYHPLTRTCWWKKCRCRLWSCVRETWQASRGVVNSQTMSRVLILHMFGLAKSISQQLELCSHWKSIYMWIDIHECAKHKGLYSAEFPLKW